MATRRIVISVHLVAVALWLAVILGAGASAAVLFPTLRDLDPALPAFADYDGPHWRLTAGRVAATIFALADRAQLPLAAIAFLTAGPLIAGLRRRRPAAIVALIALLAATALLAYQLGVLRPRMDEALALYWAAAESGDTATAETHAQTFSADHPLASRAISGTAICVFIALTAAAAQVAGASTRQTTDDA
ncbi:MAG: hypothetical protein AAF138_08505 [Planctomycetota bacterium]